MASVYSSTIKVPLGIAPLLAERASVSMGDTYLVASELSAEQGTALIAAGKAAFSAAHVSLLSAAAAMMGILAIAVFFLLAGYRPVDTSSH